MTTSPMEAVRQLGGVATRTAVRRTCSRWSIDRALERGDLIRLGRSTLALPQARTAVAEAREAGGVVGGESAALHWGWAVARAPGRTLVILPRNRGRCPGHLDVPRRDLPVHAHRNGVLTPVATVIDCARSLAFDTALAVADSALRSGRVTRDQLSAAAGCEPPSVRRRVRRVVDLADGDAANPFESVARARAIAVGLDVVAQHWVDAVRPDMTDTRRRIIIECDSYAYHSEPAQFRDDVRRYTRLTVAGWIVVRLVWEDVMAKPEEVLATLRAAMALADSRA